MSRRRSSRRDRFTAFSGSVAFDVTPYYAAGIKLDLDAATANITQDGSNRVSQWSDKSGNAYHAVQATGANQPLWLATATPKGLPAVHLDSTARFLAKSAGYLACSATGYTWIGVVQALNSGTAVSGFLHSSGSTGLRPCSRQNSAQTTWGVEFDGSTRTIASANDENFHVVAWRIAASGGSGTPVTTAECYVDGTLVSVTGTPNFTTGPALYQVGANGSSRNMKLARVLEAPATLLSAQDVIDISNGLRGMYI